MSRVLEVRFPQVGAMPERILLEPGQDVTLYVPYKHRSKLATIETTLLRTFHWDGYVLWDATPLDPQFTDELIETLATLRRSWFARWAVSAYARRLDPTGTLLQKVIDA